MELHFWPKDNSYLATIAPFVSRAGGGTVLILLIQQLDLGRRLW